MLLTYAIIKVANYVLYDRVCHEYDNLIIHFPASLGVSERARAQSNERSVCSVCKGGYFGNASCNESVDD